jgi:protein phosphatase
LSDASRPAWSTFLKWGAASAVGHIRGANQDSVFADPPVFGVADGMGGRAAGGTAARLASDGMLLLRGRADLAQDDVIDSLFAANQTILDSAGEHDETSGMGTTVSGVCLVVEDKRLHWLVFNVGDSRVYRHRAGRLEQVTRDHSELAELVAEGHLTADDAALSPLKNMLTRWLGSDPAPIPDAWVFPAGPGDQFIICTDGLTKELEMATIVAEVSTIDRPQLLAERLVEKAVEAGGRDNVSVVVVRMVGEPATYRARHAR